MKAIDEQRKVQGNHAPESSIKIDVKGIGMIAEKFQIPAKKWRPKNSIERALWNWRTSWTVIH